MAKELKVALDASSPEVSAATIFQKGREGLRVILTDTDRSAMFLPGTATPTAFARLTLQTVASRLRGSSTRIAIEAHTDSLGSDSSNWRLSAARAEAARNVLMQAGLPPGNVAELVALAGTQPIYPKEPNRPENRRVAIVILAEAPPLPSDSSFSF
jgi:chemotaxis protein MotB